MAFLPAHSSGDPQRVCEYKSLVCLPQQLRFANGGVMVITCLPCCFGLQSIEPLLKVLLPAIAILLEFTLSGTRWGQAAHVINIDNCGDIPMSAI
jgi:hypothetical protein